MSRSTATRPKLVEYVYINNQRAPLDNADLRQALCYAVDYTGIIDYVLQGNGVQMRGPVPKGMWGHKEDLSSTPGTWPGPRAFWKKPGPAKA